MASGCFLCSGDGVQYGLEKASEVAGLTHVRFHDFERELKARWLVLGLTIGELQAQSGHATRRYCCDM